MDAFQRDLPLDQFVRLQIAGDLITKDEPSSCQAEGIVATGYLAIARRFGHDIDKDMYLTHEDVIDNVGKNFLGLTLGCARCHDHKYDPISAEDYYALYGIFDSSRFAFPGCEPKGQPRDLVPLVPQAEIDQLRQPWLEPEPTFPVAYAVIDSQPKNACLHERGDPAKLGKEVPRRWLSAFGGSELSNESESGRRELAEWITNHPLFARVMVNRIWEWHFGRGLVRTSNDFGARGERPTHLELLDRLAAEFVASGYSVKALHRRIMLSDAYQRASATPVAADAENRLLAHFNRRRLTAEELRDSLLTVSQQIDLSPAEAHPFPSVETWKFTQHAPFNAVYETNRRSAFLMVQRQRRHPYLALFDGANPNASTPARQTTTIPSQALYFMNDPFFHQQAAAVSRRVMTLADESVRMVEVFNTILQRKPSTSEQDQVQQLFADYPGEPVEKWAALCRVLMASNEFMHVE